MHHVFKIPGEHGKANLTTVNNNFNHFSSEELVMTICIIMGAGCKSTVLRLFLIFLLAIASIDYRYEVLW